MERTQPKRRSLLVRIFVSFLAIITLLSAFNYVLFSFFQQKIQEEIIRSNRMILEQAAERYHTHFERLRTVLFQAYNDSTVKQFNNQLLSVKSENANYYLVVDIVRRLRESAANPLFYLDNLIVLYRSNLFMADKEGSSSQTGLDALPAFHAPYDSSYWQQQFERTDNYRLHSAQYYPQDRFGAADKPLIPLSFKLPGSNYMLIAMLDAGAMNEAMLGEVPFLIQTEEGGILYRSPASSSIRGLPGFETGESFKLYQDHYFFVHTDPDNRLRYITAVPYAEITAQISKLRTTHIVVQLLAIVLALGLSYWFSRRLQSPVKRIIASLQQRDDKQSSVKTEIHEFAAISDYIGKLKEERAKIHDELRSSKSLLTNYSYIAKLKSLDTDIAEWRGFMQEEGPFSLVLYQLNNRRLEPLNEATKRTIGEYIDLVLSEHELRAYTFQIENDQIVSVVFLQPDGSSRMPEALHHLKQTLDSDRRTCLVTIAVSSAYLQSADLHEAYEQVSAILEQARPLDETQIITEPVQAPAAFVFPSDEEQELHAHLEAGNVKLTLHAIQLMLETMARKGATLPQCRRFAESFASRIVRAMEHRQRDASVIAQARTALQSLKICCTGEEFKQFFHTFVPAFLENVQTGYEHKKDVIAYIMQTIENRYSDDISLDIIAAELKMSSAYLSVYIKEKTGENFIWHLNRIRIQNAKKLLASSDLNIQSIGEKIGYRNVTSFNRMFKKLTGATPGEYRRCQTPG
ncbi:helix-turn-helix domain-containing protein [Paenibacillus sp. GCM10027626]|uniref:helix-turn-helix transcriptional regulator n=1 Tax=Paenibacillus sp. GCM10027626 TaxID=3273411 RepID=UPI00363FC8EE